MQLWDWLGESWRNVALFCLWAAICGLGAALYMLLFALMGMVGDK